MLSFNGFKYKTVLVRRQLQPDLKRTGLRIRRIILGHSLMTHLLYNLEQVTKYITIKLKSTVTISLDHC